MEIAFEFCSQQLQRLRIGSCNLVLSEPNSHEKLISLLLTKHNNLARPLMLGCRVCCRKLPSSSFWEIKRNPVGPETPGSNKEFTPCSRYSSRACTLNTARLSRHRFIYKKNLVLMDDAGNSKTSIGSFDYRPLCWSSTTATCHSW